MKKFQTQFLEKSKDFVEKFDIDEANKEALKSIFKYFAGINTTKYPINKGLLIHGTIGSGKTLVFKIIQKLIKELAINNSRDVVADFNIGGFEAIDSYIKTKTRVFDDIGQEHNGKYYGNETNVIQELIIRRYERFQNSGQITHFTTNFGAKEHFITRYGERAYDRLREMCSSIILGDNNTSRRTKYNPVQKNKPIEPKVDKEKLNKEATNRLIKQLYNGEACIDSVYVIVYDHLKANKKLLLTEEQRDKIAIQAKQIQERLIEIESVKQLKSIDKLFNTIKLEPIKKKIAVIEYFEKSKELGITVDEITN